MEPPFWLQPLSHSFPCLYDLFLRSQQTNPSNWFCHPTTKRNIEDTPPDQSVIDLERNFQELDEAAWKAFVARTAPCVCIKDQWGHWTRLYECFNELHGYLYLKSEGYTNIRFIKERAQIKTPDLYGQRDGKWALLEVKTLHERHDTTAWLMRRGKYEGKEKNARKVGHQLPSIMKKRLTDTIESARKQLKHNHKSLPHPITRKIVYLAVWFDTFYPRQNHVDELQSFLKDANPDGIETVLRVMNPVIPCRS